MVHGTGADSSTWGDFPRILAEHGFAVTTSAGEGTDGSPTLQSGTTTVTSKTSRSSP
jgi:hypothetical protein